MVSVFSIRKGKTLISPVEIRQIHKTIDTVIQSGKFKLLKKTDPLPVRLHTDLQVQIPEDAHTFTKVVIGKDNNSEYKDVITTFFSSDGQMIKRVFQYNDKPTIVRDYKTKSNLINGFLNKIRLITEKKYNFNKHSYELRKVEEHKTVKNLSNGKVKLQINKNIIDSDSISSTVTEYPLTGKETDITKRKILSMNLLIDKGIPTILSKTSQNISIPSNDKFLPFRMIFDKDLKRYCLTKYFLKEKGLTDLKTSVSSTPNMDKNIAAYFSDNENRILFNSLVENNSVELAAHEVHHAYQIAQVGRLGKGQSHYCIHSRNLLGEITDPIEREKALRYYVSYETYPKIEEISENKSLPKKYSFLEEDANQAAKIILKEYNDSGEMLGKQFKFGNI